MADGDRRFLSEQSDEARQKADSLMNDTAPSVHAPQAKSDTAISQDCHASSPAPDLLPFERLGHYEILERTGHGGMGDVYKAYERSLDRTVAIKVLPLEFSRSEDFVRRFYAEAAAIACLVHPNVIQIFSMGEDRGYHYFAMQYIEGLSLANRLAVQSRLSVEETLDIVKQLLLGLAAAHEFGLIHRDIKPGNILLEAKTGKAYLADFGLVKSLQQSEGFTATGMVMGTVDYISPEQGRGLPVDGRADLYSLGIVIYRMLSGRLPFEANSPTAMIFQHVYETPCPLSQLVPALPAAYSRIVDTLLAKNPEDRYPTATALLNDLNAAQDNLPLSFPARSQPSPQSGTAFIQVPSFPGEPNLPDDLDDLVQASWWQRLRDRVVDFFFEPSPELYHHLQTTRQQVDGAVATYERRHLGLHQLAQEADSALAALNDLLDEWISAAENAEGRINQTSDPKNAQEAQAEYDRCQARIAELCDQIEQQTQQRDEILHQHQQVKAKLAQIHHQRDLLVARLKVAQAQRQFAGGVEDARPSSNQFGDLAKRGTPGILWMVLGGMVLYLVLAWSRSGKEDSSQSVANSSAGSPPASLAPFSASAVKQEWSGNGLGMVFCWCPPGTFTLGSPLGTRDRRQNENPVEVTLTEGFWLGKYEVTQKNWQQVMGSKPWEGKAFAREGFDNAVSYVSWTDAMLFCERLTEQERKANRLPDGWEYTLPTEAQWERACRAGTTTIYSFGDDMDLIDDYAWNGGLSTGNARFLRSAHPVGRKLPNAWGLHDMHGNVWEWCLDTYREQHRGGRDPVTNAPGTDRVLRGGGWNGYEWENRSAIRRGTSSSDTFDYVGFRVACVPKGR